MGLTDKVATGHNMVNPEKMANEHTPLISTVRTAPPRQRYPHHVVRRFCTIALSCSLIALFTTFLFSFGLDRHGHEWEFSWPSCKDRHLSYEELKKILLETPSSEKAEEWQKYYTEGAHLAGQNYSQVCSSIVLSIDSSRGLSDHGNRRCGPRRSGQNGASIHQLSHTTSI